MLEPVLKQMPLRLPMRRQTAQPLTPLVARPPARPPVRPPVRPLVRPLVRAPARARAPAWVQQLRMRLELSSAWQLASTARSLAPLGFAWATSFWVVIGAWVVTWAEVVSRREGVGVAWLGWVGL